jgi:hypothetical protein
MPEWLIQSVGNGQEIHFGALIYRLFAAALLGGLVSLLYWYTHRRDETLARSFISTLVLLAILIAMVTQVIGDSVARAFSLVGALSIVRFRTVVEDTRDTAFVIFTVIVGMAVGANHIEVALAGLLVVGLAAVVTSPRAISSNGKSAGWQITLRMAVESDPMADAVPLVSQYSVSHRVVGVGLGRQGTVLDVTLRFQMKPGCEPVQLVSELLKLDTVLSAEVRAL